jgi:molecular chaperone DnaJ
LVKRDYYNILGISRDVDEATIKRAYRHLAMQYHPDKNPGDANAVHKMKEINEAYAVLSDPEKRRRYDAYGHAGLAGLTADDIFGGVDFAGLFREFGLGNIFGESIFDSFFARKRGARARAPQRGADLKYELEVTLEDAAFGAEKKIEVTRQEKCPACGGTGASYAGLVNCEKCLGSGQIVREQRSGFGLFRQVTPCPACGGRGQVVIDPCGQCQGKGVIEKARELTANIPAGIDTGQAIKITGEGEAGEAGAEPGDLYIVIQVKEHPLFERRGDDIYLQQEISFPQAALGGEVLVSTLDGEVNLEIPEGTQTGDTLRIAAKGVQHLHDSGRGNQCVVFKVVTPTDLGEEEKEILKKFQELRKGR